MSEETQSTVVTTGVKFPVRVSYFKSILGKKKFKDGKDTGKIDYGTMILIPKEDTEINTEIKKIVNRVAQERWGKDIPKGLKISYRDGDKDGRGGVPDTAEASDAPYGGNHFINLTADRPPYVYAVNGKCLSHDKQGTTLDVPADLIVSGDYVIAHINCYTWSNENGNGISWGLRSVQQFKKGEPLSEDTGASFKPIDHSGGSGGGEARDLTNEGGDDPDDIMSLV